MISPGQSLGHLLMRARRGPLGGQLGRWEGTHVPPSGPVGVARPGPTTARCHQYPLGCVNAGELEKPETQPASKGCRPWGPSLEPEAGVLLPPKTKAHGGRQGCCPWGHSSPEAGFLPGIPVGGRDLAELRGCPEAWATVLWPPGTDFGQQRERQRPQVERGGRASCREKISSWCSRGPVLWRLSSGSTELGAQMLSLQHGSQQEAETVSPLGRLMVPP